ncbi:glycosyltransferase family 2 protein [Microbacteriaceae bacterium VKM Ac-2855]|nr:glycosyltransferase family 2 protein [Microbacteriaceae bacterium VKM Ac-2855]
MRLALVSPARGNRYMREILEGIAYEANAAGISAAVVDDVFPEGDDIVYVVIPHEYFALVAPEDWPDESVLSRTFALTVEHPGTQWFETSAEQARRCGGILDINRDSAAELRRRGQPAVHFQLGYTEFSDAWHGEDRLRSTDVLYLGSTDEKRDRALAGAAPFWWDRRVRLLLPSHEPKPDAGGDFIVGRRKLELLSDTRILVNLHRDRSRSLEWVRVLEAIANGAVVYSEHSVDAAPLVSEEHFVSVSPENLGVMTANALGNEEYLDGIRRRAYDYIRGYLRLSTSVEILLAEAERLLRERPAVPSAHEVPVPPGPVYPRPAWEHYEGTRDHLGEAVARLENRVGQLTRALAAAQAPEAAAPPVNSPAWLVAQPRVSVIIPMHNAAAWIVECLDSAVRSTGVAFDIVVLDDASTDASARIVRDYILTHPEVPLQLLHARANRGPSATRNELLENARGEFVFLLDADNGIYPSTLATLVAALDDDPKASFAYGIISTWRDGIAQSLISSRPWNPRLFRFGNYIDNMALLRTAELRELGGWDASLTNWEDFQLWLRYAEAGKYAAFVPSIVAWYRVSRYSRSMEVSLHAPQLWTAMRSVAPGVLTDE